MTLDWQDWRWADHSCGLNQSQVIFDGHSFAPHTNGAWMGGGPRAVGSWLAGRGQSHGEDAGQQ